VKGTCPKCGLETPIVVDGIEVDACFGARLTEVVNACCGHGDPNNAYVRISTSAPRDGCGFTPHIDICGGEVIPYTDFLKRQGR
jgi:hypothetical protein